jgi:WhiB family redox-sensing transcriptional regulator
VSGDPAVSIPSSLRWTAPPAIFDPQKPAWVAEGACIGVDPEWFFPDRGEDVRRAKAICATCPVKDECLEYALENREKFGIWGGTSERERRGMRSRRSAGVPADPSRREQARALHQNGVRAIDIANVMGVTRKTVYRYIGEESA